MSDLRVAQTILEQLGGANRLSVMIGAHSFMGDEKEKSLTFKYKARSLMGNCIKIELDPMDTYTVTFYSIRNSKAGIVIKETGKIEDVFAENLKSMISDKARLALTMPTIIFKK